MTEDSSDNFSEDSLEDDRRITTVNLTDFETQIPVIVEENSEITELTDKISATKNTNTKLCASSVPFYSGSISLSDIQKIQKVNMRSKVNERICMSFSAKAGQYDRGFSERNERIESWRANVQLHKNTTSDINNKTVQNSSRGKKERSQSLVPICLRSTAKIKIDELPKIQCKRCISNESRHSFYKDLNSVVSVKNESRNTKPKTYGQNQKSGSYLEQYRLKKYGRNNDKGDASKGYASTLFSDTTELRSTSSIPVPKKTQDSKSCIPVPKMCQDYIEYSEDLGIVYMKMIDDGLQLHAEDLDNNLEYDLENSCELNSTIHTSSDQACLENTSERPIEIYKNKDVPNYVPYTINDYRVLLPTKLGKLGPDVAANQEKLERVLKRREYGELANMRNREIIRLKNMKEAKIKATKSEMNVSTLSKEFNNHHAKSTSLPLNSKNVINTVVVKKRIGNIKLPSDASISNQESKKKAHTVNVECSRNKAHTEKLDELKSEMKKQTFKSNKDKIIQMQERHQKEIEITEDIRKTHSLG